MGKKPNLDNLDYLFECGTDFQLSGKLYEEKAGIPLPKGKSYLKNRSALAYRAKERGFEIVEIKEEAVIERTVIFKKKEG